MDTSTIDFHPRVMIHSTSYDPHFRPLQGILRYSYNGAKVQLKVDGVDVHICMWSREGDFCKDVEQDSPAGLSWQEHVQNSLEIVVQKMLMAAVCQVEYLKSEGLYHVQ